MKFKSESERKAHPQAGLIAYDLWNDVFEDELLDSEVALFSEPIKSLLSKPQLLKSQTRKKAAWICFAIGHSNATIKELLSAGRNSIF